MIQALGFQGLIWKPSLAWNTFTSLRRIKGRAESQRNYICTHKVNFDSSKPVFRCLIITFQKLSWRKASIDTQKQENWIVSQTAYCKAQHFCSHFVWLSFFVITQEQSTALPIYLGKTDPIKLSKSGIRAPAMYLNQNWFSHKAWTELPHWNYRQLPRTLMATAQPPVNLLSAFGYERQLHTFWIKVVQNACFVACWSWDLPLDCHEKYTNYCMQTHTQVLNTKAGCSCEHNVAQDPWKQLHRSESSLSHKHRWQAPPCIKARTAQLCI